MTWRGSHANPVKAHEPFGTCRRTSPTVMCNDGDTFGSQRVMCARTSWTSDSPMNSGVREDAGHLCTCQQLPQPPRGVQKDNRPKVMNRRHLLMASNENIPAWGCDRGVEGHDGARSFWKGSAGRLATCCFGKQMTTLKDGISQTIQEWQVPHEQQTF